MAGSQFRIDKELNTYSGVLEKIVIHENFSRSSLENNLGIGFVSFTFRLSKCVKILSRAFSQLSVELHDNNIEVFDLEDIAIYPPKEGMKCEIFGWSLTTQVRD